MAFNYQVTAQQPTAVTHVLTGNFTRPEDNNVVICKVTHIEIHLLTPEGPRLVVSLTLAAFLRWRRRWRWRWRGVLFLPAC